MREPDIDYTDEEAVFEVLDEICFRYDSIETQKLAGIISPDEAERMKSEYLDLEMRILKRQEEAMDRLHLERGEQPVLF